MRRQEVIDRIRLHEAELRRRGVESLELFGSTARDEAAEASDVDLLMRVRRPFGLFQFAEVKEYLEKALMISKVDLLTPNGIAPSWRETIQKEAVRVF